MDFITQMLNLDWLFSWKVETKTSLTSRRVVSLASIYGLFFSRKLKPVVIGFVPSGLKSCREASSAGTNAHGSASAAAQRA